MLSGYTVRRLSRVYRTPYFTFLQEGCQMAAHAFDYSGEETRKGDVCVLWVSFWEDGWSDPEMVVCAEDGGDIFVQAGSSWDGGHAYPYYRLYPEEVHRSIIALLDYEERSIA